MLSRIDIRYFEAGRTFRAEFDTDAGVIGVGPFVDRDATEAAVYKTLRKLFGASIPIGEIVHHATEQEAVMKKEAPTMGHTVDCDCETCSMERHNDNIDWSH